VAGSHGGLRGRDIAFQHPSQGTCHWVCLHVNFICLEPGKHCCSYTWELVLTLLRQYVNPIGLKELAWKFYFVYIVILILEVVIIYFLFVETKGPTLEEIATLFDGDRAAVADEGDMANRISVKARDDGDDYVERKS